MLRRHPILATIAIGLLSIVVLVRMSETDHAIVATNMFESDASDFNATPAIVTAGTLTATFCECSVVILGC